MIKNILAYESYTPSSSWVKEEIDESKYNPEWHSKAKTEKVGSLYLHQFHDAGRKWEIFLLSQSEDPQNHKDVISHLAGYVEDGKFVVDQAITRNKWKRMGYGTKLHELVADKYKGLKSSESISRGEHMIFEKLAKNPKYKVKIAKKGNLEKHELELVTSSFHQKVTARYSIMSTEMYKSLNDAAKISPDLAKGDTKVWYAKDTKDLGMGYNWCEKKGCLPDPKNLKKTHVLLGEVKCISKEKIFGLLQGEIWSPKGEAHNLIDKSGAKHTSMSVGDIVEMDGKVYMADMRGFKEIHKQIKV